MTPRRAGASAIAVDKMNTHRFAMDLVSNRVAALNLAAALRPRCIRQGSGDLAHFRRRPTHKTEDMMAVPASLDELAQRHRALERRIEEEMTRPSADDIKITELKRQKLRLKDEIAKLKAATRH
jgi:hypothetical protein